MDEEGYLRSTCLLSSPVACPDHPHPVVGRIKDLIIRGGENLFPVQIENVLCAHPSVQEAAAVAVPDARYGEVVGAWVLGVPGAPRVSAHEVRRVVAEGMNPQNAPAYVWFIGEDYAAQLGVSADAEEGEGGVRKFEGLPKTGSGKVMKHVLRRWSRELAERGIGRVV